MSMGSVLLRPQALTATVTEDDALLLALTDLLEALSRDEEASGEALEIAFEEAGNGMRDFVVALEEPLRFAEGKLRNVFAPVGTVLQTLAEGVSDGTLESLPALLSALSGAVDLLSPEKMGGILRQLVAIAEEDLGLTAEGVTEVAEMISIRIETRCMAPLLHGASDAKSLNLYEIGSCIERLRYLVTLEDFEFSIDLEDFISTLVEGWSASDAGRLVDLVADFLAAGTDVVGATMSIVQLLSEMEIDASLEVHSPSLGGASQADMADAQSPGDPIAWYASWVAGRTVRYPTDQAASKNVFENEWLDGFGYKNVSKEKMEAIARISAWAAPALEMFLHSISIEKGDIAANTVNLGLDTVDLILKARGVKLPTYAYWLASLTNVPVGFEGARFTDPGGVYVLFNIGHDYGEMMVYRRWTWLLREALLSTLTLLNDDPGKFASFLGDAGLGADEKARAKTRHNNNCIEGVCYALGEIGALILPLALAEADRPNEGFLPNTIAATIGKSFLGLGVSAAFMYLGVLLTRVLAGQWPSDWNRYGRLVLSERMLGRYDMTGAGGVAWGITRGFVAIVSHLLNYTVYLYMAISDNTDDGKYCVDVAGVGRSFPGYPAASGSPYRLPFASGVTHQCVQGNQGMFSHYAGNAGGNQTYAYDFSHDVGEEVLCSREGVVVEVQDTVPTNNTSGDWNYVQVMHVIADSTGTVGLAPVPAPAGSVFVDPPGASAAGTLFPPYWPDPATGYAGAPIIPPLHTRATVPVAWPAPNTTFSFLLATHDRAISGVTFSNSVSFSDNTPIPAGTTFPPGTVAPPAPGTGFPSGTTFIPNPGAGPSFVPLLGTFCTYGHGQAGFLNTVYGSTNPNAALGQRVRVGQPVMLADNTGLSAFNHLHTHVTGTPRGGRTLAETYSLPFVYSDATHTIANGIYKALWGDGRPRKTTFYTSTTARTARTP